MHSRTHTQHTHTLQLTTPIGSVTYAFYTIGLFVYFATHTHTHTATHYTDREYDVCILHNWVILAIYVYGPCVCDTSRWHSVHAVILRSRWLSVLAVIVYTNRWNPEIVPRYTTECTECHL